MAVRTTLPGAGRHALRSIAVALLVTACAGSTVSPATPASPAASSATPIGSPSPSVPGSVTPTTSVTARPPAVGIVAIGHSGLTGEYSNPEHADVSWPPNSWATGTNPDVDSIYLRMVKVLPETKDHVVDAAVGGSKIEDMIGQARNALAAVPTPRLAIIQAIDNDIRCDGTDDRHVPEFGTTLAKILDAIQTASPDTDVLVVSQIGRPAGYAAAIATRPAVAKSMGGTGMCDFFDEAGKLDTTKLATLTGIIEQYEAEQARVCARFARCHTDDGVFTTFKDDIHDLIEGDWNHLTVHGLSRAAKLMWPVVVKVLKLD